MPSNSAVSRIIRPAPVRAAFVVTSLLAAAVVLLAPRAARAQDGPPRVLTGVFSGSVYAHGSDPRGDFGKNTGTGWGGGVTGILRIDPSAILNLRADAGFLTYANSRRRIDLAGTGGLVKLDLKTSSNIASLVVGPQLLGPTGAVRPYVSALGGFSVFWTQSSVEGTQSQEAFATSTNSSDAALAYGGATGLYIRVANGSRPVRIDLGARILRHDNVKYLNDERVKDAFNNNRDPIPVQGRADFVTYYAGVNVVLW